MKKSFKVAMILNCLAFSFIIFNSCSNQESDDNNLNVKLVAEIGKANNSKSRYQGSDVQSLAFSKDSKIGMFINNGKLSKWTLSVSWVPDNKIMWQDRTSSHSFFAFSPYKEGSTYNKTLLPDLSSQEGDITNLDKYDFIVAAKNQTYNSGNGIVAFTGENCFKHKCCLIKLRIDSKDDLKDATITSISITGDNVISNAVYSFDNKKITEEGSGSIKHNISINKEIDMTNGINYLFLIVVPSQTNINSKITITYTKDNVTHTVESDNFAPNGFIENKQQYYNIKVEGDVIKIENPTISDWDISEKIEDIELK